MTTLRKMIHALFFDDFLNYFCTFFLFLCMILGTKNGISLESFSISNNLQCQKLQKCPTFGLLGNFVKLSALFNKNNLKNETLHKIWNVKTQFSTFFKRYSWFSIFEIMYIDISRKCYNIFIFYIENGIISFRDIGENKMRANWAT